MNWLSAALSQTDLTTGTLVMRLLVAMLISGAVGIERELSNQPAGFRTHIIIAVGATLLMFVSLYVAATYGAGARGDPARIAAQVVSGIGFLGAGAILRFGADVRGLTTAASIWSIAAIGLAVGAGLYVPAVAAAAILLFALVVLDKVEHRFFPKRSLKVLEITSRAPSVSVSAVHRLAEEMSLQVEATELKHAISTSTSLLRLTVYLPKGFDYDQLSRKLAGLEHVEAITLEEKG